MNTYMLDNLEQTAARVPEKTAFYDDRERLTFAQLCRQAKGVGSRLAEICRPRTPVALLFDPRSIRNIPALYGALYAGCAYAPLDVMMPPERLALLLALLAPSAILADAKGMSALEACGYEGAAALDERRAAESAPDEEALERVRRQRSAYDPMSILYTSGSTGIPKGSIQNHFSYLHWTQATIQTYGLTADTVFGNQSPFFYANSILDIFPPVALGATVYLMPSGVLTFPKKLIRCLNEQHISLLCMTPSSFISVVNADVLTTSCLPELKWGIMSGEPMPWQPLEAWMQATPNADWWHFYGSTEMFSVAVGRVDKNHPQDERLPVGKPFKWVDILFVDENMEQVQPGQAGEMLVSSPWIARGYHRDDARTQAAWLDDPLGRGWHQRFYRAGDIGCLRPDGQLMVLGRRDAQIKHMGYRMELGEVEAALRSLSGWKDGCVLHQKEKDELWCFYTGELEEKQIKQALKEKLARYMLPDVYVRLDELPHTSNMKLDRKKLAEKMD